MPPGRYIIRRARADTATGPLVMEPEQPCIAHWIEVRTRGQAVGQDQNRNGRAFRAQARDSAAAAEHLVVRMSGDNEDVHAAIAA